MNEFFKVLPCDNYQEINADLLSYIKNYMPHIIDSDPRQPGSTYMARYANFPESTVHFAKNNPKLIDWCKSHGMIVRDAYFTLAWYVDSPGTPESSCPLHLDKPPVYWKLNWPILNMERTSVRFYLPKDRNADVNQFVTRAGEPDSKDHDVYLLPYKEFDEVCRHDFVNNEPVIMNGQVGHDIGFYPDPVFPRVGVQVMFVKEPTHLL